MSDPKLLVLMSCEESMCCTEPDFNCDQKQFVEHIFRKGNQVIGEESVTNRKCDGGTLHALPCWNTPGYNMPDMFVCIEREKKCLCCANHMCSKIPTHRTHWQSSRWRWKFSQVLGEVEG